jgi:hypothetical protein
MKGRGRTIVDFKTAVSTLTRIREVDAVIPLLLCPVRKSIPQVMTDAERLPRRVTIDRICSIA